MTTTITIPALQTPVTHAWTGAANSSASTESVGGVVQRRNLVANPGFEGGNVGSWVTNANTLTVTSTVKHSGSFSGQSVSKGGGNLAGAYNVPVVASTDYVASSWVSIPTDLSVPYVTRVNFKTATGTSLGQAQSESPIQFATDGWAQIYLPFTTPAGTTQVDFYVMQGSGTTAGDTFYLDDTQIELQSTYTGEYFDGGTPTSYLGYITTPLLVDGWSESAESRNIINEVLGGGMDVTPQAATLRSGSFVLVYQDEADAVAAFDMHRMAATYVLTDTDRPSVGMTYVLSGTVERTLDDESRDFWLVTVNFQEV